MAAQRKWPTAIDMYCGCGGVTEALKRRHFRVVAAIDNDPVACTTYRSNHRRVHLYEKDIVTVRPRDIKDDDLRRRSLDLLVVCAPCQPFSSQTKTKRGDSRSKLLLQAVRFARVLKPKVILFENVPGLAGKRHRPLLTQLQTRLRRLGYAVEEPVNVDAADYEVPQRRKRCILVAALRTLPRVPKAVTPAGRRVTVRQVIGRLKPLRSAEKHARDTLHFARNHRPIALKRLKHVRPDGGDRLSIPSRLRLLCHAGHKGHPDVYGRMKWDDVAPTLTTGCTDVTRGRFAHPRDNRAITLREAARLQTFPDSYQFCGNPRQIATQIGNAVPIRLIEAFSSVVRQALGS